ncbi:MAG: TolC family outer membrane protein [Pseudomonadota bacterium]
MTIDSLRPCCRARTAILAIAIALAPVASAAETLADTLTTAYRNSNLLEQNRAVLRAADEDVAQAIAALRPTLDFILNTSTTTVTTPNSPSNGFFEDFSSTMSLVSQIVLFEGGRLRNDRELAKETVLATRDQLKVIEQNVLLNAVDAFFDVLSAEAFVSVREDNVRLIGEELQAARDRFEVGEVTRTDVALAESRLAAARSQLAAARGDLDVAEEVFRTAVGRYPGDLQRPATLPATAPTEDAARDIAVRRHPSIQQAQREVTVAELAIDSARAGFGPTISANLRGDLDDDGGDSAAFSLQFSQRLYSGGNIPSLVREAAARRDQSRANLHQTTLGIAENVGTAWATVAVAQAQIVATAQQVRAAQIAFEGTREEARLGARTTLDVLDAEQDLLDARADQIDAVSQQNIAVYSLLSAMGLLTVEHLQLGVQTYDPVAYYNAVDGAPARHSKQGQALDRVLRRLDRQ